MALTGSCPCGTVRFEVTEPFESAGYCHCKRCQRRTGSLWSINAITRGPALRFLSGREAVRMWRPAGGSPKSFCGECGGHLYSGDPDGDGVVGVRIGALDGDPGIQPSWRQWLESAHPWDTLPDDGLERFERSRFSDAR